MQQLDEIKYLSCNEYNNEIALWRAILMQVFEDLANNYKGRAFKAYKKQAISWFIEDMEVKEVCELAHVDYNSVRSKANNILKSMF